VQRPPRRGRYGNYKRKPKRYTNLIEIRSELINQNIQLTSEVLGIGGRQGHGLSVGKLLATLCSKQAVYTDPPQPRRWRAFETDG
jgi:hypothetical protein